MGWGRRDETRSIEVSRRAERHERLQAENRKAAEAAQKRAIQLAREQKEAEKRADEQRKAAEKLARDRPRLYGRTLQDIFPLIAEDNGKRQPYIM